MAHVQCMHLLEELSAYLDGAASQDVCAELEQHLSDCADCHVVVDTLRKTIALYRELPKPGLPSEARARLYKMLDLSEFMPAGN